MASIDLDLIVEVAKREAKCFSCKKPIPKAELRIGQVMSKGRKKWFHPACQPQEGIQVDSLVGFADLDGEEQASLCAQLAELPDVSPEEPAKKKRKTTTKKKGDDLDTRLKRALKQRMYLLNRVEDGNELRYKVRGASGKDYWVTLKAAATCSCMDFRIRKKKCKHLIFIITRVLGFDAKSSLAVNTRPYFSASEMNQIRDAAARRTLAQPDVQWKGRSTAAAASSSSSSAAAAASSSSASERKEVQRREPGEDDECVVCYEALVGEGEALDYCKFGCGNALHAVCANQWLNNSPDKSCPMCRVKMV